MNFLSIDQQTSNRFRVFVILLLSSIFFYAGYFSYRANDVATAFLFALILSGPTLVFIYYIRNKEIVFFKKRNVYFLGIINFLKVLLVTQILILILLIASIGFIDKLSLTGVSFQNKDVFFINLGFAIYSYIAVTLLRKSQSQHGQNPLQDEIRDLKPSANLDSNSEPKLNNEDEILVKSNRKTIKVLLSTIYFIESYGDYIKIHTDDDIIVSRQKISHMNNQLPKDSFLRIHRSYIVSINKIAAYDNNYIELRGKQLKISRTYKPIVKERLRNN